IDADRGVPQRTLVGHPVDHPQRQRQHAPPSGDARRHGGDPNQLTMSHLPRALALARPLCHAAPRRGIGLVELIVSITVLGVVMSMVGGLSSTIAKYGRADDLRTKRNLALQQ